MSKSNKLYKILFILLHIICLIMYVTSCIKLEGVLDFCNGILCTTAFEHIVSAIKSVIIYVLIYRAITNLIYRREYSKKNNTTLSRYISIALCIVASLYLIFIPVESMPVVSLINAPISGSVLKIIGWVILIVPLIMIYSIDLLRKSKNINLEKKDLFLLIGIFAFVLLVTVIFEVNSINMYFANTVWQDFHKHTSMYYFTFLILPVILNDIYILVINKENILKTNRNKKEK